MWYRNTPREAMYRARPDTHFRYDVICAFLLFISMAAVQLIVLDVYVINDTRLKKRLIDVE